MTPLALGLAVLFVLVVVVFCAGIGDEPERGGPHW